MSDLESFQSKHGEAWEKLTQHPAFSAAMEYLNIAKMNVIAALSDEEIAAKGALVLADLRGHLRHENDLIALSALKDFTFPGPLPETYSDPAKELSPPDTTKPRKKR